MKGFIAIHRSIQEHWIFDDAEKLRAWLIMLMAVNHKENKTLIKGKVLTCPRGQSVLSHSSWASKFGKKWNRNKVIRFFKLLESEHMIEQVNEQVTTRVTICNYSQYQDLGALGRTGNDTTDSTPSEHQANTKRTQLNNDNNENNVNHKEKGAKPRRFNFKKSLLDLGISNQLATDWMEVRKKKRAANTETAFKAIAREIEKSGLHPNDAAERAVKKSWAGFEASWVNKKSFSQPSGYDRRQQAIDDFVNGGSVISEQ